MVRFIQQIDFGVYSEEGVNFCRLADPPDMPDLTRADLERLATALFDDAIFQQIADDEDPYCCPQAIRTYRRRLVGILCGEQDDPET